MKVYIASPYTMGDKDENTRRQIDAFFQLMQKGHTPFAPLLLHFVDLAHPLTYNQCLDWDLEWLAQCDCVLRLSGVSRGADIEVQEAIRLGVPVYYSIDVL